MLLSLTCDTRKILEHDRMSRLLQENHVRWLRNLARFGQGRSLSRSGEFQQQKHPNQPLESVKVGSRSTSVIEGIQSQHWIWTLYSSCQSALNTFEKLELMILWWLKLWILQASQCRVSWQCLRIQCTVAPSHTPDTPPSRPSQVYSLRSSLVEVAMPVVSAAMPGAVASERCEPGEPWPLVRDIRQLTRDNVYRVYIYIYIMSHCMDILRTAIYTMYMITYVYIYIIICCDSMM